MLAVKENNRCGFWFRKFRPKPVGAIVKDEQEGSQIDLRTWVKNPDYFGSEQTLTTLFPSSRKVPGDIAVAV
jgi:hypothetical protein